MANLGFIAAGILGILVGFLFFTVFDNWLKGVGLMFCLLGCGLIVSGFIFNRSLAR